MQDGVTLRWWLPDAEGEMTSDGSSISSTLLTDAYEYCLNLCTSTVTEELKFLHKQSILLT